MQTLPPKLAQFLQEYAATDVDLRADLLIELSERFREVSETVATRPFPCENKVPACESDAYVFTAVKDEGLHFYFAVENPQGVSAKALAVLLEETLSGVPAGAVAAIGDEIVYELFGRGISMGKGIGLRSMVQCVRAIAEKQAS